MTDNGKASEWEPTAFRMPPVRKTQLRLIQQERGHANLSITLNEAVDQFIEAYLRQSRAA